MEAQLIETFLLNALNYPTLIATKASRICEAAQGEPVIEFGLRRAQGPDGGLTGSRAAYIGGCSGTSNVLAGRAYGIPVSGTMAHSWIMAMPSELDAFRAYVEVYPENPILLVDTYDDIHSGIPNAIAVFKELRAKGRDVRAAIRLDSGDLARLSKIAYEMMTAAGFKDPMIVASNELEEDLIADLKRQGARINAWGVGTHLITGKGDPSLSGVYKLSALETDSGWDPRLKISSNPTKTTDPGVKRIVRYRDRNGHPVADLLCAADEAAPSPDEVAGVDRQHLHVKKRIEGAEVAEELLWPVVENGKRVAGSAEDVHTVRQRALEQVASLPDELKRLRNPERYPVLLSPSLARRKEELLVHYSNEK